MGTERGGGEGIGQDLIGDRIGLKPYLLSERQLQRGQNFGYQFLANARNPLHVQGTPIERLLERFPYPPCLFLYWLYCRTVVTVLGGFLG